MLNQKLSLRDYQSSEEVKAVARKLHRIKRRLLRDITNDGGCTSPENRWISHESLNAKQCACCSSLDIMAMGG